MTLLLLAGRALSSLVAVAATFITGLPQPPAEDGTLRGPNAVELWNDTARNAAFAACLASGSDPLHESRMYAMASVAVHDALNAIDRRYGSYSLQGGPWLNASTDAAVAAAARTVLVSVIDELPEVFYACRPPGAKVVEDAYAAALKAVPDGPAKDRGVAVGAAAGNAIIATRVDDGSATPMRVADYPQGTMPGEWRFTADRLFAFAPGWARVKPFGLSGKGDFLVSAPYRLTSKAYARDVAEIKALGGDGLATPSARTPDQTEAAGFWLESSPLKWNRIARELAVARGLDSWRSARLFAMLNMALADGYVASWSVKYQDRFWRPVTAIQQAATDGNPATTADPTWTPLDTTPPIPGHDSAESVQGAAAATVLAAVFGSDRVTFITCSLSLPDGEQCDDRAPTQRRFTGFWQAARENAESRIWMGSDFRHCAEAGLAHGRWVAGSLLADLLEPVPIKW
jgi:hypothetical protein